ncbi:NACHT domain-containing protein [Streptomyces sp. P38-E01]|uniref:NACHT domain-containing protein n=1 Tax=Streptomyces tardus TaxID=2780544 RepID=A0A949JID5_9ACTN|nr:NACHT domain-containing protein [Streptomyces tardus]MBU7599428.1 NACHT domain-containing protein [Streptomyces tardus]
MEPAVAARLAVTALTPLLRKLFVSEGTGAGVVDRPVRLSGLVSFRGEKQVLEQRDLHRLVGELVRRAAAGRGPREQPSAEVRTELANALFVALRSVGDLQMDDVQAAGLEPARFARELASPGPLSGEAQAYFGPLLEAACEQILHFFTQRSTFVARTLVEQTRALGELDTKVDRLLTRTPSTAVEDARFEERYAAHVRQRHGELTIYGLDSAHTREWPLDAAYLTLEATDRWDAPLRSDDVLADRDRVLLRGAAGSGKTTLIQWLAVAAARQPERGHEDLTYLVGRVPFVLPLRRVLRDDEPPTPDRFLHAAGSNLAGAQPAGWADRVLAGGRALMLIDGIDEVPANSRTATRRWIRELARDYPGNLWLVTARPASVDEDWLSADGFGELSLAPMSRTNVLAFVKRWHHAADADRELADALIGSIRAGSDLGALAVNPLMCGLLCALHRDRRGFLPHSRKDLYEAALAMLLERRDLERGIQRDQDLRLSREVQVQLLQKLAHWLIRNDRAEMDRDDARAQLARALGHMPDLGTDAEGVLRHLLSRSGLLREPAPERIDFVHRTFQDYLGAKAAVEEVDFPLLLNNAHKPQWEDVLRMAVALARPAERARILNGLIDALPTSDAPEDRRRRVHAVLLATSCLDQATELDPDTRRRVRERATALVPPRDGNSARRLAELAGPLVLGLLPGPEAVSDEQARHIVVTAAHLGTDDCLAVLARYRDHPSLAVRSQLAWSWHRFDTRQYAEEIIGHLDPANLYFPAHNDAHLRALQLLGGRPRVQVTAAYHPEQLAKRLDRAQLKGLWLRGQNTNGEDWEWLRGFPHLETVLIEGAHHHLRRCLPDHVTVTSPSERRKQERLASATPGTATSVLFGNSDV